MSNFRIKTCVLGMVSTNCYLVFDQEKREAVIIDPADNGAFILNKCRELELTPVAILLTHGHFDHIMAVQDICRAFRIPVYAGQAEQKMLEDPGLNLSGGYDGRQMSVKADHFVKNGETLSLIGYEWNVYETPGHTAGSVCYYLPAEEVLFSGDTLFEESLGRTDLPTGSSSAIVDSILEKLFTLPDDTMVYPGHGDPTSIGHEKQYNPVTCYRG